MDNSPTTPAAASPSTPTEDDVRRLAEIAGVTLPPERLPVIAAHLAELRAFAADLRAVDLDGVEPEAPFDPRWPEGEPA